MMRGNEAGGIISLSRQVYKTETKICEHINTVHQLTLNVNGNRGSVKFTFIRVWTTICKRYDDIPTLIGGGLTCITIKVEQ